MSFIGYILLAILVLLVMITVHELGHYIAGKIFKFGIEEFAIGFGPKIFSKKKNNGEIFSIRALPIGGFCAFKGEDKDDEDPTAFNNKKPWQRIIVLISGAFMNFLFALLLIVIMFSAYGQPSLVAYKTAELPPEISVENSFRDKDVILGINGKNIYLTTDLMNAISGKKAGDKVSALVRRGGKNVTFTLQLRTHTDFKNMEDYDRLLSALGIYFESDAEGALANSGLYSTYVKLGFFQTLGRSFDYSFRLAGTVFKVLGELITGALGLNAVGGTVTTIGLTANAIKIGGFRYLLNIASLIGVNLAVFNLLPIPALDGSRVVFTVIEWIRKKPLNRRVEGIIHGIGLVLLLIFAVVVDLQRCF
ncbi:MAG: site-2 protease family protein [Clostridia bacterium]|nr:site-2 protease family protein [Clostridia bacterium]